MKVKINYKRIIQHNKKSLLDKKYIHFCLLNQCKTFEATKYEKMKYVKEANMYTLNDCPWIFHISDLIIVEEKGKNNV